MPPVIKSRILFRLSLFLVMVLPTVSNAQEPYFREVTTSAKLTDEQINCIYQDSAGYMWIGTTGGIYIYNGVAFNKIGDPAEIIKGGVTAIFEDSKGNMWFGLDNGHVIRYTGHRILEPVIADSLPSRRITAIIEGNNKRVWIGTYGNGIYYTDNLRMAKMGNGPHLTDNYIYSFEKDARGRIWVGTDNGINILDVDLKKFDISQITVEDGLPDFIIQHLEKDWHGNMWIGMHEYGVCCYDVATDEIVIPPALRDWPYGSVSSILAMDDRLWISTNGQGLIEYKYNTGRLIRHQEVNGVNLSRIKTLMQDMEGNVWLTSNTEISLSLGNRLEFIRKAGSHTVENIHALISGDDGYIWYANDRGVFRFVQNNPDNIKTYRIGLDLSRQKIMSLYEDPYGFIWIGTFGQGLIRLDPASGKYTRITEQDGLVNGNVLSIKGTPKEMWFATLGGVSRIYLSDSLKNPDFIPHFDKFGKKEGLGNNFIYDLHIAKDGRVLFATDGSGVIIYEDGRFRDLISDSSFNNKVVYSVTTDGEGNTWMNIAHEGLYRYDGDSINVFYKDPEHGSFTFSGIQVNPNNELIIAYSNGIDILQAGRGEVIHYEGNAGLENINPDLNTISMDAEGCAWIGTSRFIVRYKPRDDKSWLKPRTRIDKVSVFLEEIDPETDTVFGYADNHFSFDYSGLWFQYPEKVTYYIKLEGHDLDWMVTRNNNVIYSNLSPGPYTFRVRSGLYRNFSNASEASWSFTIRKPYWQTVWFYTLLAVAAGLIVFGIIRIRERNISKKQEVIREKIKFQFENLKSQINPHFLFNSFSTLIALIETDTEEAINYVDELSALFRNVLEYKDRDVITLEEELGVIDNYISLQKKRYGPNLQIDIEKPADSGIMKIPPLTLQLLIENAIKHNVVSKEKPLKIRIYADISKGFIFVTNSLRLKKEVLSSTGIGIENIINRYRILTNREIVIDKTEEQFTVGVPIIYE